MNEGKQNSPDKNQPRIIYLKQEFFSQIESGSKTLELRVRFSSFSNIKAGDILEFKNGNNQSIQVKVREIRTYSKLVDVLEKEEVDKIAPGFSKEQILVDSEKFFKQADIKKNGLIVIDFEKVEKDLKNAPILDEEIQNLILSELKTAGLLGDTNNQWLPARVISGENLWRLEKILTYEERLRDNEVTKPQADFIIKNSDAIKIKKYNYLVSIFNAELDEIKKSKNYKRANELGEQALYLTSAEPPQEKEDSSRENFEQVEKIAQEWLNAFNAHDLEKLLSLYDDNAEHYSPKLMSLRPETEGKITGKESLRDWWQDAFTRLPTLKYEKISLNPDDKKVTIEYRRKVDGEEDILVSEILEIESEKIVRSKVIHR